MTGIVTALANKIELWCWMESERLLRPVFREFYAERDVVFEERRLRTEDNPGQGEHGNLGVARISRGQGRVSAPSFVHLHS